MRLRFAISYVAAFAACFFVPSVAGAQSDDNGDPKADADVEYVRAVQNDDHQWTFFVTVGHPDTGWEDYADGWDVLLPDGSVLKPAGSNDRFTRVLLHPHVNEQPFTRSQRCLRIPDDVPRVVVRAHDIVDGWGGATVEVDLTAENGNRFEVQRSAAP